MPALKAASEHGSFDVAPTGTFFSMAENNGSISRRYFDEKYVRGALRAGQTGTVPTFWGLDLPAPRTNVWMHLDYSFNGPGSSSGVNGGKECFGLVDPSGTMIVEIRAQPGVRAYYLSYYDPGGQVTVYGPISVTNERVQTFDIFLDIPAKTIQLYVEGALAFSTIGSVNFAASSIGGLKITGRGMAGWFSQALLADESTVGWKVALAFTRPLLPTDNTSFPTFNEWIGQGGATSFALDASALHPQFSSSTFVSATVPGQKSTTQDRIPLSSLPVGGPQTIESVVQYGVAANSASSSVNGFAWICYRGGTVYQFPDMSVAKDGNFKRVNSIQSSNPVTGSGWLLSDFADFQMGITST